ncbi:MAG: DUF4412 domain-containing protein [Bacteroidetes bacterium]|nr:DUF4412 domain-containing protein [Bacteroidota bacterium]
MKKIVFAAIAICFAAITGAQNGAHMEYKITSSNGTSGTVKMNYSEYGSLMDFNMVIPQMPGGGMQMKHLTQKSNPDVVYSLNDKDKTYSEQKTKEAASDDSKTYTVKKLGEEKVNGYKCVHAMVTEGKESHEVWNTKDIAEYEKYSESFRSNKKLGSQKREQALKDAGCDGMPVKTVHKGNEREGDMTMELVKYEKKNFSKGDFEIPVGFTKGGSSASPAGMKSAEDIRNMTPEERTKYIEEMKKKYGK